ncbi:hypothetical protein [Pseudidiomarina insulisalsae]|uniref:ABC transporter substrate-binding protein n=1 Tax=Pseudidiomarina insulisalsae TaxID=575789 RepID=A0A432YQM3_9GAMM|nr:hypothetical protein [Pseudidiomarina insulisalsae]RUO63683.1 hypothetical protein CWI71_01060 [Pseudidiomarina insulisalsae]
MRCIVLLAFLVLPAAHAQSPQPQPLVAGSETPGEMVFRTPDPSPITRFAVQLLSEVYAELDITLRFIEMPRDRSLTEANKGRIAGELGRIPRLGEEYSNLIRVDFPLFTSRVVLVADRRKCGLCNFDSIDSYAYIGGTQSVEQVIDAQASNKPSIKAINFEQLEMLYENGRVQAVLLNDFEAAQLKSIDSPYTIQVPYTRNTGYHFLHKRYAHLVPQVEAILQRKAENGRIAALSLETGAQLLPLQSFSQTPQFGPIRMTGGLLHDQANLGGGGQYWQLAQMVFRPVSTDVEVEPNNITRAYRGYVDERFEVYIGGYTVEVPSHSIASRNHIDFDKALYLFARDDATLAEINRGQHKRPICHIEAYQYDHLLPPGNTYYAADSHLDCFAMLDMGRMGAVVGYRENVPDWRDSPYVMVQLREALPIHIYFRNNPRGVRMRDWFDKELRRLVESGEIRTLYDAEMLHRSRFEQNLPRSQHRQGPQ